MLCAGPRQGHPLVPPVRGAAGWQPAAPVPRVLPLGQSLWQALVAGTMAQCIWQDAPRVLAGVAAMANPPRPQGPHCAPLHHEWPQWHGVATRVLASGQQGWLGTLQLLGCCYYLLLPLECEHGAWHLGARAGSCVLPFATYAPLVYSTSWRKLSLPLGHQGMANVCGTNLQCASTKTPAHCTMNQGRRCPLPIAKVTKTLM